MASYDIARNCLAPTASLQIHKISWDEAIPLSRRFLNVVVEGRRPQVRIPAYTRDLHLRMKAYLLSSVSKQQLNQSFIKNNIYWTQYG